MEEKKTVFNLRFDAGFYDWTMTLHTTEPMTDEEIEKVISKYSEIVKMDAPYHYYCPVDILDRICDDKGWSWENLDWDEIIIKVW